MSNITTDLRKIIKETLPYHTTDILVSYLERAVRKITTLQADKRRLEKMLKATGEWKKEKIICQR